MALQDFGYADLLDVYELTGYFVINGRSYVGAVGDLTAGADLGDGGFGLSADLQIVARADQFGAARPKKPQTVAYNGKTYRISGTVLSPCETVLVMNLVDATRGV